MLQKYNYFLKWQNFFLRAAMLARMAGVTLNRTENEQRAKLAGVLSKIVPPSDRK